MTEEEKERERQISAMWRRWMDAKLFPLAGTIRTGFLTPLPIGKSPSLERLVINILAQVNHDAAIAEERNLVDAIESVTAAQDMLTAIGIRC